MTWSIWIMTKRLCWLPQLLQMVHQGILQVGMTPSRPHKKGNHMEMDPHRTSSIRHTQKSSGWRTCTPISPANRTIWNGSGCICHSHWCSSKSKRRRWKNTSSGILLRIILRSRKKLQHLWQRTTGHRKSPKTMEDLFIGIPTSNNNPHGSFQSAILERTMKNQLKGSKRVPRIVRIWLHALTHPWSNEHKGRCTIKAIKQQRCQGRQ